MVEKLRLGLLRGSLLIDEAGMFRSVVLQGHLFSAELNNTIIK